MIWINIFMISGYVYVDSNGLWQYSDVSGKQVSGIWIPTVPILKYLQIHHTDPKLLFNIKIVQGNIKKCILLESSLNSAFLRSWYIANWNLWSSCRSWSSLASIVSSKARREISTSPNRDSRFPEIDLVSTQWMLPVVRQPVDKPRLELTFVPSWLMKQLRCAVSKKVFVE